VTEGSGALTDLAREQIARAVQETPANLRAHFSADGRLARCLNVADLREGARKTLPGPVFDFVEGGAGDEVTVRRNREAFAAVELRPRVFRDVSSVATGTTVLGESVALPLLGAPHGSGLLFHPEGEVGVARALHAAGTIAVISALASQTIEEVARAAPGPKWFQIYLWRDRGLTRDLIRRAIEAGGYSALVVTADVPRVGPRERDLRNGFTLPPKLGMRTIGSGLVRPRWSARFLRADAEVGLANLRADADGSPVDLGAYTLSAFDAAAGWDDIAALREIWPGPMVVKGILTAEDAVLAAEAGVDAISVSNHGGRQLDHGPAALAALPAIVDAVGDRLEVYVDGGIRRGTDLVKAVALGARACLTARPLIYGLALAGQVGVARAVEILRAELETSLALVGAASPVALDRDTINMRGNR
jgi:L-lactate dehydrogenase (cytochrome)